MPGAGETITVPQATALINEVLGEYGPIPLPRVQALIRSGTIAGSKTDDQWRTTREAAQGWAEQLREKRDRSKQT